MEGFEMCTGQGHKHSKVNTQDSCGTALDPESVRMTGPQLCRRKQGERIHIPKRDTAA